jgi:NADPH:quinone reductase-like Zn-dependent oxidoreductase
MNLIDFFLSKATLRTIGVGSREDLADMNRALSAHDVHPVIDTVFPFEQARLAFKYFARGQHFGKVVINH